MRLNPSYPQWLRRAARLPRLASQFFRWGAPRRAILFGPHSLGDDLLCTAILREARLRSMPFAMLTARPELFEGNPDPSRVLPIDDYYATALRRTGSQVVQPYYAERDPLNSDRDVFPARHIIAEMCRLAGLSGTVALRPYLFLSEAEKSQGVLHSRQIALHSSAAAAAFPFANKEWGAENFAAVVRLLSPDFHVIQIGSPRDPALPVDTDLRGKTTLRETAAVIASSLAFVGLEGFLSHLARAVDTPAAVIFGGRARPETVGYSCNANHFSAPACSPCGLRNTCAYSLACMGQITPVAVATSIRELAARRRAPLFVDKTELP